MKETIFSIIFLATAFLTLSAQPCKSDRYKDAIFPEVNIYEDITYSTAIPFRLEKEREAKDYHFDFYEPLNDDVEKRPLVLMFCGGNFQKGDKKNSEVRTWCDSLASYGFTCAAVNYRLGYNPENNSSVERAIYRSVQDVRAAIRYFKEFHHTFKIDTNQIYLGGDEAGAVAVLHAAFMSNENERTKASYGISNEKLDLGCLDCSGNKFSHNTDIAGLINMRGQITSVDLLKARKKIPIIHVENEAEIVATESDLSKLNMASTKSLHDEMDKLGYPTTKQDVSIFNSSTATGMVSSEQIWLAVWQQIRSFLYSTMTFETVTPIGPEVACAGKPTVYEAVTDDGENYCWQVRGGKIIENNGKRIRVAWNYDAKEGAVRVTTTSATGFTGKPSKPLKIKLHEVAVAEFTINTIQENVIEFIDNSSYGSFFTLDFGDGSSPQSGRPNEKIVHTYDLKGEYMITQILENNCGSSVATQPIKIKKITSDSWEVLKKAVSLDSETYPLGSAVTVKLNAGIHYPKVRIKITADATEEKVYDKTITLAELPAIELSASDLKVGKYTIAITADDNTVRDYFTIE